MDGTENYREEFNQDSGRQMSSFLPYLDIVFEYLDMCLSATHRGKEKRFF